MTFQTTLFNYQTLKRSAKFSDDGKHRFWLCREWDDRQKIVFIGLNPSTANEKEDDPTIKSCIRITKNAGFGGFFMLNLYSFITSDPDILVENFSDANREQSDAVLLNVMYNKPIICAWGSWKFIGLRVTQVLKMIDRPLCLGINANGSPRHPLFLKSSTQIQPYTAILNSPATGSGK
jgi:hypothetical protein